MGLTGGRGCSRGFAGSDAPVGAGSNGTGRGGSAVVAASGSRSDDNAGRFEAGGGARPSRSSAPSRSGNRRDPVDLSDYDFDELADIFRPEPTKTREQPRQPVKPTGVEAGRGR